MNKIEAWVKRGKRKKAKNIKKKVSVPIPGVEPGPPGWKPGILTARPYGRSHTTYKKFIIEIPFVYVNVIHT